MQIYNQHLLREVQMIELNMAKFFVNFCKENNLLCYFCGGGCIGTIRHHGFIPWDDDLDFFLPRADYEKLKEVWKDTDRYTLLYPTETYNDHSMYATLRDKMTTMIKPNQMGMDIPHGISMDIFPLDGYPNSRIKRKIQVLWALIYQLFCAQMVPVNHGRMASWIGQRALDLITNPKTRYKIWAKAEQHMTRYKIEECDNITEICAGPYYLKKKYPKDLFAKAIFRNFEDTMMPIPIGYDKYLTIAFGDYMELPPKEKQVPSHDAVILDTGKPYTAYMKEYLQYK